MQNTATHYSINRGLFFWKILCLIILLTKTCSLTPQPHSPQTVISELPVMGQGDLTLGTLFVFM